MFFERRRAAKAIIYYAAFEGDRSLSSELMSMMMWGAKNLSNRRAFSKTEAVIIVAATFHHNQTAIDRLADNLGIGKTEAKSVLLRLAESAIGLAREKGLWRLVETIYANDQSRQSGPAEA